MFVGIPWIWYFKMLGYVEDSSNNKTLNTLLRHTFVTGATLLQLGWRHPNEPLITCQSISENHNLFVS